MARYQKLFVQDKCLSGVLLFYSIVATSSTVYHSTAHNHNKFTPSCAEDVGLGHTKIIHNLQDSFQKRIPKSRTEYLHAISMEVRKSSCHHGDSVCHSRVVRRTIQRAAQPLSQVNTTISKVKAELPEGFDMESLLSLERLFAGVSMAKVENSINNTGTSWSKMSNSEVIALLDQNMQDLKHSKSITSDFHRDLALVAHSVAMESTKQWTEVIQDPTNPFNMLMNEGIEGDSDRRRRELQLGNFNFGDDKNSTEMNDSFVSIIESDIRGAIMGVLASVFDRSNTTMLSHAVEESTISSLIAFFDVFFNMDVPNLNYAEDECSFPVAFWCVEDMLFDNEEEEEEGENDYCPFPNLPDCGLDLPDDVDGDSEGNSDCVLGGIICNEAISAIQENVDIGDIINNNGGTNGDSLNEGSGEINNPDDADCLFPTLPNCGNINVSIEDTLNNEGDIPIGDIVGSISSGDVTIEDVTSLIPEDINVENVVDLIPNEVACMFPNSPLCNTNKERSNKASNKNDLKTSKDP